MPTVALEVHDKALQKETEEYLAALWGAKKAWEHPTKGCRNHQSLTKKGHAIVAAQRFYYNRETVKARLGCLCAPQPWAIVCLCLFIVWAA